MKKIEYSVNFASSVDKIWRVTTDYEKYEWRSDLSKIEIANGGNSFTEYTKKGVSTECTVTLKIPHERYEYDIKNDKMSGHFTRIFTKVNGRAKVTFLAEIEAKGVLQKFFAGRNLRKQQKRYIQDLKKALGEFY